MSKILTYLPLFIAVARQQSFTLAAEELNIPLPTLSRRIAALEKELGVQLLQRSTRRVELTVGGLRYYERCRVILEDAENAREELQEGEQSPSGRVRLSVPADIYYQFMGTALSNFAGLYPGIELHVHFASRHVDLRTEPFDLDIRWGEQLDSELRIRKLVTMQLGMYASPQLLERFPRPKTLQDVTKMPLILQSQHGRRMLELHRDGKTESIPLTPSYVVNSMGLSLEFALAGCGVTSLAIPIGDRYEKTGELVRLLPEWNAPEVNINMVMPPNVPARRIRLFIDFIAGYFSACGNK